jgi:predicted flap endonuclease-1-like 5' DNA nuclease
MTYLLLQTFLLLLASYFFGAFLACTAKRLLMGSRQTEAAYATVPAEFDAPLYPPVAVAAPRPVPTRSFAPPVVPRPIDPVQPRIDVIRRPEPRPMPKLVDPSRFERALMGPDLNEGMPRRAIPEIRPAVLMPVTGAYQPGSYGPPPEPEPEPELPPPPPLEPIAMEPEPEPYEPAPVVADVEPEPAPEPIVEQREKPARLTSRLSDATTSAAAAAVAAAKAAAAASISSFARRPAPERTPEPEPLQEAEPAQPLAIVEQRADEPEDIAYKEIENHEGDPVEETVIAEHAEPEDEEADRDHLDIEEPEQDEPQIEEPTHAEVPVPSVPLIAPKPFVRHPIEGGDDFQRIRAIDANLEQRLKMEGVDSFEHIAAWSPADVKRFSGLLDIPGRIDREQWVEQAQILAKGGETYYSRNRVAALKAAAPAEKPAVSQIADLVGSHAASESRIAGDKPQSSSASASVTEADSTTGSTSEKEPEPQLSGVAAAIHGRSVAEMAAAAAAAIAAASASVTRGLKPIEPISPLAKVDPKISMPAKLSDAIKVKEAATAQAPAASEAEPPRPMPASSQGPNDDLKRIRGVGVLIEKRLNAIGISRYEQVANWTSGDIDRVSQVLEFKGRIEREGWVEQARILLNGGQTEFSRRVDRGEVDTSRET